MDARLIGHMIDLFATGCENLDNSETQWKVASLILRALEACRVHMLFSFAHVVMRYGHKLGLPFDEVMTKLGPVASNIWVCALKVIQENGCTGDCEQCEKRKSNGYHLDLYVCSESERSTSGLN